MAQYYIKDVIKSMLNMDSAQTISEETEPSLASGAQRECSDDDGDLDFIKSTDSLGGRSPGGGARGRSVKEFEEQLSGLKKENFNLKLRIYFLEERMGNNACMDQETAASKNIELMVQVETLRKEVAEKQKLLCQAVKAIDLEEEEHKKDAANKEKELQDSRMEYQLLMQRYEALQEQFEMVQDEVRSQGDQCGPPSEILREESREVIETLENKIENLEKQMSYERSKLNQQLQTLRTNLEERTLTLSNAKKRIDSLEGNERQIHQQQKKIDIAEAKLAEYEELIEKYRRDNEDLELRLQSAQNEVKMRGSPSSTSNSPKSLSRLKSPSTHSPLQNSSKKSLSEQTLAPQPEIDSKVELKKACKIIQTLLEKHNIQDKEIKELQKGLKKRDEEIEELSERLKGKEDDKGKKSLRTKISELNLTAAAPASDTERSILENLDDPNEIIEQYRQLTHELDVQKQILEETLKIKTDQMKELQEKYEKIVEDLNQSSMEKTDEGNEKVSSLLKESEEKDKVIERLEKELQKRTCDLQGVVNKELWDKNREIEKLQSKFGEDNIKKILEEKEETIRALIDKLEEKKANEEMLIKKLDQVLGEKQEYVQEIEELKHQVSNLRDVESEQIKELRKELEHSEILRLETNEVCNVLSIRLKELALFLDSLLKQKSVLGLLGHQSRVRQYVDQTLDLSRSLSMTINMNPNESLLQLSNISDILKASHNGSLMLDSILPVEEHERTEKTSFSVVPEQITLTYQSHLNIKSGDKVEEQEQIIKVLRNQVEGLKREIELRDIEMSRLSVKNDEQLVDAIVAMEQPQPQYQPNASLQTPDSILESLMKINLSVDKNSTLNTSTTLKYSAADISDCESVSEPDISVSKARIGLTNESLKPRCKANHSESTETGFIKSRTPSKRIISTENKQIIKALTQRISELETSLAEAEVTSNKANAFYRNAAETQENLILRIKDLERQLVVAQEIKMSADLEIQQLQRTVEELQSNKFNLIQNMDMKSKNVQNMVNQLECEKAQALNETKLAEERFMAAKQEVAELQQRLQEVHGRTEEEFLRRIDLVEKDFDFKVKMIESKADAQITKITEAANELKTKYETEYVKRNEVENLRIMINDLESLQQVLGVSEDKIDLLKESERQLKDKLERTEKEYHSKLNDLRAGLDKATLQYSQSILEKTKLQEEKSKLEDELKSLNQKKSEFESQVAELKTDFQSLKEKFQKQVSSLETQKTKLQLKISELESGNAVLKNRLIKLQSQREGESVSSPSSPSSKILDMYFNKTPELPVFRNGGEDNNVEEIDRQGNSSPDLGIESDQGRFSSLEAQVSIPRPYLKSLELTQSMSNLLDKENSILAKCNHDECRETLRKIMDENTCLHKKLQKSRRLLEETVTQLAKANQRKKEVEKNICREIHKTSQVLRKAKANLESSSDTDFTQKK